MLHWARLVRSLDSWTAAAEVAPGRIEVLLPPEAARRQAVVVMTPDEWDELAGPVWGSVDDAVHEVKRTLLGLHAEEGYVVFAGGGLEPSVSPTLPRTGR